MNTEHECEWVTPEWKQRGLVALRETVDRDPDLKRQMIEFLFACGLWSAESLTYSSALSRFNACLNPERSENFRFVELWALMRQFDRHQLFLAMADDLGYEVRRRATPERQQALMERLVHALEESSRVASGVRHDLAQLTVEPPTSNVHPAFRGKSAVDGGF